MKKSNYGLMFANLSASNRFYHWHAWMNFKAKRYGMFIKSELQMLAQRQINFK